MSDALEIRAPAEQTEGTRSQILRWLKRVGEQVSENEPLIEIETDKVTVEVAAPRTPSAAVCAGRGCGAVEPRGAPAAHRAWARAHAR